MAPEKQSLTKGIKLALDYTKKRDIFFKDTLMYIRNNYDIKRVLYPGSYTHISPSLLFPETVYVDSYKKTKLSFDDENLIKYINKNKEYKEKPIVRFHLKDYRGNFGEKKDYFDLMISMSAGFISVACDSYLKRGSLFLADNHHNDAARAYISDIYEFLGVFTKSKSGIQLKTTGIEQYFQTQKGNPLTLGMVEEVLTISPSRMSYKYKKKASLYLFRKI